jgi:hypothetical protein
MISYIHAGFKAIFLASQRVPTQQTCDSNVIQVNCPFVTVGIEYLVFAFKLRLNSAASILPLQS